MALTANTIPSQVPNFATPYDATNAFASAQTLTATGYINNLNAVVDLGGGVPVSAAGRMLGMWCFDITAIDVSSTDESYKLFLFASNDAAFGNGNVDIVGFQDLAAVSAGREVATILGATPTLPPTNLGGALFQIPFVNMRYRIVYRYLKMYAVLANTTPSITIGSAWISKATVDA